MNYGRKQEKKLRIIKAYACIFHHGHMYWVGKAKEKRRLLEISESKISAYLNCTFEFLIFYFWIVVFGF